MNCIFFWRKRLAKYVEDVPCAIYRGASHQHQYHENSREVENSAVVTVSVGNFMLKEKKFSLEAAFDHFKRIFSQPWKENIDSFVDGNAFYKAILASLLKFAKSNEYRQVLR